MANNNINNPATIPAPVFCPELKDLPGEVGVLPVANSNCMGGWLVRVNEGAETKVLWNLKSAFDTIGVESGDLRSATEFVLSSAAETLPSSVNRVLPDNAGFAFPGNRRIAVRTNFPPLEIATYSRRLTRSL
jgi:hypothetical protein